MKKFNDVKISEIVKHINDLQETNATKKTIAAAMQALGVDCRVAEKDLFKYPTILLNGDGFSVQIFKPRGEQWKAYDSEAKRSLNELKIMIDRRERRLATQDKLLNYYGKNKKIEQYKENKRRELYNKKYELEAQIKLIEKQINKLY